MKVHWEGSNTALFIVCGCVCVSVYIYSPRTRYNLFFFLLFCQVSVINLLYNNQMDFYLISKNLQNNKTSGRNHCLKPTKTLTEQKVLFCKFNKNIYFFYWRPWNVTEGSEQFLLEKSVTVWMDLNQHQPHSLLKGIRHNVTQCLVSLVTWPT